MRISDWSSDVCSSDLGGSDRVVQVLDSLIISIGLAVLAWVFVISPVVRDPGFSGAAKATAVSYPAIDVLLLGAVIRLLVQGRLTSVGDRLLTGWVCVQLTADLVDRKSTRLNSSH